MQSENSKEEFLKQLENIVGSLTHSRIRIEQRVTEEHCKRDQLSDTLHSLIDLQRRYFNVVKELSLECKKHETLLVQCRTWRTQM